MVAIVERVGQTQPTETEPARIVVDIYCRVSTDPQEDNTSLDEQEAAGRAHCLEHGYIVGMVHREVFSGNVYREREKLADHVDLIKKAIELATNSNAIQADAKAIDMSLATWEQKAKNYLEDLEDPTLKGDSRVSIRQALNTANEHIEKLREERTQVLLGMIDQERERAAYQDILAWCQTVKDSRGELSYQRKRDFLHLLGVVVIAKKDETGNLDIRLEIELPEIKELIGQTGEFEERDSARLRGSVRTASVGGYW